MRKESKTCSIRKFSGVNNLKKFIFFYNKLFINIQLSEVAFDGCKMENNQVLGCYPKYANFHKAFSVTPWCKKRKRKCKFIYKILFKKFY